MPTKKPFTINPPHSDFEEDPTPRLDKKVGAAFNSANQTTRAVLRRLNTQYTETQLKLERAIAKVDKLHAEENRLLKTMAQYLDLPAEELGATDEEG